MTDRVNALTVVLDRDMRDDDVQCVVDAIRMIKCVANVSLNVVDANDYINRARIISDSQSNAMRAVGLAFDNDKDLIALLEKKRAERGY
jgi:hypothetical protein